MRSAHLEPENVHIDHGVAEVSLDVRHRLAFDLETVADPDAGQDLVE